MNYRVEYQESDQPSARQLMRHFKRSGCGIGSSNVALQGPPYCSFSLSEIRVAAGRLQYCCGRFQYRATLRQFECYLKLRLALRLVIQHTDLSSLAVIRWPFLPLPVDRTLLHWKAQKASPRHIFLCFRGFAFLSMPFALYNVP